MSDSLWDGKRFRLLNILDDFNREVLAIEVDTSLPAPRLIRVLDHLGKTRGLPKMIRVDNGPEFISDKLDKWSKLNKVTIAFIQPGKPTQNAYIERFNRTARHEWLDLHSFVTLDQAQELATQWLWQYNNERPHTAIGDVPPRQLLMAA